MSTSHVGRPQREALEKDNSQLGNDLGFDCQHCDIFCLVGGFEPFKHMICSVGIIPQI